MKKIALTLAAVGFAAMSTVPAYSSHDHVVSRNWKATCYTDKPFNIYVDTVGNLLAIAPVWSTKLKWYPAVSVNYPDHFETTAARPDQNRILYVDWRANHTLLRITGLNSDGSPGETTLCSGAQPF